MATETRKREWLSVKELAFELGLHPSTVYRVIDNGSLPVFRLHEYGAIRVHRSVLDQRKEQP